MKYFFTSIFIICALFSFSQKGRIIGRVINSKNGEPLIGATIKLINKNKITQTDLNGNYSLSSLDSGKYSINCSYVSFTSLQVLNIDVRSNQTITRDIILDPAEKMNNVIITSSSRSNKPKENISSLLLAQKNSSNVSDGISADLIKRTPDRSTSDILKRVSGVSIQNDKFVIIRGLNDRYNSSYINGSPLPSTEGDRKAFSFDIFPSNLLDNLVIIKTATPDIPAEFAGGSVFINTKDVIPGNFQNISFGLGFNSISTFKDFKAYYGGRYDFLGFDDGKRALPSNIPSTKDFPQPAYLQPYLAKSWNNVWATHNTQALPNLNLQYVLSKSIQRKGNDFLGTLFSFTYSRNQVQSSGINRSHQDAGLGDTSVPQGQYTQSSYSENILLGALANFSLKINNNNSIYFKNLFSANSEDLVFVREGYNDLALSDPVFIKSKTLWYTSNRIFSSQLIGEHYFSQSKIRINWMGSYSSVLRDVPDLRTTVYSKRDSETDFIANVSNIVTSNGNGGSIYYSKTNEDSKNFKIDIQRNFKFSNKISSNFKTGIYYQGRDRYYNQRNLGMVKGNVGDTFFNYQLLSLPDYLIFGTPNIGSGKFILAEDAKGTNGYSAKTNLSAGYLMADQRFGKFLRLVYGVRIEKFDLKLFLPRDATAIDSVNRSKTDILPSGSAIFSINKKQNFRFAYSKTVNRPEFRELSPTKFYDVTTRLVINGDTGNQRALIDNYDLRYEIYPRSGQVITLSAFYKKFTNPLEQSTDPASFDQASYFNVIGAVNKGVEIEERLLLGDLFKNIPEKSFLNKLTFFSNFAFIKSSVTAKTSNDTSTLIKERPLQGQSPYCFNGGFNYQNDEKGISATILANRIGQRIFIVGNIFEDNLWENGRTVIDVQFAKKFKKNDLEIKFNIKDLLAQRSIFFEDTDDNQKYVKGKDYVRWYKTYGQVFSFTLTYKF